MARIIQKTFLMLFCLCVSFFAKVANSQPYGPLSNYQCKAIVETPIRMEISVVNGNCDSSGLVTGRQKIYGHVIGSPSNLGVDVESDFQNGRPNGKTDLRTESGVSFSGLMYPNGQANGISTSPSGMSYKGEFRGIQLWDGVLTSSPQAGGQRIYYYKNVPVSENEYAHLKYGQNVQNTGASSNIWGSNGTNTVSSGSYVAGAPLGQTVIQSNQQTSIFGGNNSSPATSTIWGSNGTNTVSSGSYVAGAPLGQTVIQSNQQTSIFGGNNSSPASKINTPTFGGNASPQAPIVSAQILSDSGIPSPVRNEQSLQPPLPLGNTPALSISPPVQPINPPTPLTSADSSITTYPLPAPFSDGTIGTGQTDNSNIPAPFPKGNSNYNLTPSPLNANNPSLGQSINTTVNSKPDVTIPSAPTGLYPTATYALAQPIPLGWSAVSGATRYRIAVKDLNTGAFPVDDIFVSSTIYSVGNLAAGHNFAWDVAACNSAGCSARSTNGTFKTGGVPSLSTVNANTGAKPNLALDTFDNATQGTKDCAIALARQTGESVEVAYQIITAAGGWQRLANSAANSVWNIIAHPILSAQAAWQSLRGQVGGVRDAVNSGNASLACQRAATLSGTVIGAAEGASFAGSSLSNLRKVISQSDEIANSAVAKSTIKSRGIWDEAYGTTRGDVIHQRLGQNTPYNFPVFDIWNPSTGRAVSIKSMDTSLPSYQSASTFQQQINDYVDEVANFKTTTWAGLKIESENIRSRELLLAVPPEGLTKPQLSVLQSIRDRASSLGVRIIIQQIQ